MHKYDAIWLTGQPASGKTTLANLLMKELSNSNGEKSYFNIDGDDLRDLFQNKDYSREGRERNIRLGMSIAAYLINKNCIPIVSLVSPYRFLREISRFNCYSKESLYHSIQNAFNWERWLHPSMSFRVDISGTSSHLNHSHFTALQVKNAIVDLQRNIFVP